MPEIIKPGNPEAQFPLGHVFECNHCDCQFKLVAGDRYDLVVMEGTSMTVKTVTTECPNCMGDCTEQKHFQMLSREVKAPDSPALQAVGLGRLNQQVGAVGPIAKRLQRFQS